MDINGLIGKKIDQTQGFLEDGTRIPISCLLVLPNVATQVKTAEKEGYHAIQLGFDIRKKTHKAMVGHIKKAGLTTMPRFLKEIRLDAAGSVAAGSIVKAADVFSPGDIIDVTGTSKGKGFAGVVKRHHFKGGPRTHGQSDRERAPGSIGQTTTPGRVYRGKRMAGRMGHERVTVKNLEILDVAGDSVLVKGLVPGIKGSIVMIKKRGMKSKKFKPLFKSSFADQRFAEGSGKAREATKAESEDKEGEQNAG